MFSGGEYNCKKKSALNANGIYLKINNELWKIRGQKCTDEPKRSGRVCHEIWKKTFMSVFIQTPVTPG